MEVITLKDALKEMHSGRLFSIAYVTHDKKRQTGGDIKQYDGCRLSRKNSDATATPEFSDFSSTTKRPNHYGNRTRNIVRPDGQVRKVNVWLIIRLNGKKVTLY